MKQIPNLFTLLNLVFGCLAIIFILQTGQSVVFIEKEGYTSWELPEKISWGALFIFGAAVIDFLDGMVARLFKATSGMGKQLDSLADLVSFGVAPGLIIFQLLKLSYAREEGGLDVSFAMLLPALLIPCAAAWRLARFNLDASQASSFKGVPAPAIGLVIASLPLAIFYQQWNAQEILLNKWVLYLGIIVVCGLMISNGRMLALKFTKGSRSGLPLFLLAGIAIIVALFLKWLAAPVILLAYVLVSLLFKNKST